MGDPDALYGSFSCDGYGWTRYAVLGLLGGLEPPIAVGTKEDTHAEERAQDDNGEANKYPKVGVAEWRFIVGGHGVVGSGVFGAVLRP